MTDDELRDDRIRRAMTIFDEMLAEDEPLPEHLIHVAKEIYIWRDVDVEVLDLLIDSADDELVLTRSEQLQRFIAFGNGDRGVHFECRSAGEHFVIEGSVVPPGVARVSAHRAGQQDIVVTTDDLGCFMIGGLASGSVRLGMSPVGGDGNGASEPTVLTPWFRLED